MDEETLFVEMCIRDRCYGNNELEKSENIKLIVERNNIDEAVYVGDIQGDLSLIHISYDYLIPACLRIEFSVILFSSLPL